MMPRIHHLHPKTVPAPKSPHGSSTPSKSELRLGNVELMVAAPQALLLKLGR